MSSTIKGVTIHSRRVEGAVAALVEGSLDAAIEASYDPDAPVKIATVPQWMQEMVSAVDRLSQVCADAGVTLEEIRLADSR